MGTRDKLDDQRRGRFKILVVKRLLRLRKTDLEISACRCLDEQVRE